MDLHGIFAPIPTPFTAEGEVDLAALRANGRRWMTTRVAGLVVLGSNGEAPLIDEDESDRIVAAARETVSPSRRLIVGTGRESTRATIAASCRAATLGADAVLVRTPSYFKPQMTVDAFVRHYTAVADASPVPVILYNFAMLTGVSLPLRAVERLAAHRNVVGVKESGGDIGFIADLVDKTPDGFAVLVGSAPTFYASLLVGASGGVIALACVVPDLCAELFDLVRAGRLTEARDLQRQLTPLARLVTSAHGVAGLKAALDLVGYRGGPPRPPLLPAAPDTVSEIRQALHDLRMTVL